MEYNQTLFELVEKHSIIYAGIWSKWKQINPDTKIRMVNYGDIMFASQVSWHSEPISVCRYGMKAALWRSLGSLFRKPDWIKKGMALMIPPWNIKSITLEHIHYAGPYEDIVFNGLMGYAPEIDTLFVYDRSSANGT